MQLRVSVSVFAPDVVRNETFRASRCFSSGLLWEPHAVVYKADRDETDRLAYRGLAILEVCHFL